MIICDICTGRHLTASCATAQPFIAQCFEGTVGDYQPEPLPNNVVELITELTYATQPSGRRARPNHWLTARDRGGVEVVRIA